MRPGRARVRGRVVLWCLGVVALAAGAGRAEDAPVAPRVVESPWQVIVDSITPGGSDEPWRPLSLGTFLTEGWDEAFVPLPAGTRGGLRQGYINAFEGTIYRLATFSYAQEFGLPGGGTAYYGAWTLSLPINRRAAIIAHVPAVTAVEGVPKHRGESGIGDIDIQGRAFLINSRNFDLIAAVNARAPSGQGSDLEPSSRLRPVGFGHTGTRSGHALAGAEIEFWSNPFERVVLRGAAGPQVATNRAAGFTTFQTNLGLGYVLSPDTREFLGGSTLTLALNTVSRLSGPTQSNVTLTPGFRTELGGHWYILGGLDLPLAAPRPYREQLIFWLMKTW